MLAELQSDPALCARLRERARLGPVELERLKVLPKGTLGAEYAAFMRARNLSAGTLSPPRVDTELGYVAAHVRESHDLWHVLTGFDTDVAGELGLQAFYVAQLRVPFGMLLVSLGLLNGLFSSACERERRMRAVVRGWLLGKRARPLFGVRWSELWSVPLDDLRRALGLDLAGVERVLAS